MALWKLSQQIKGRSINKPVGLITKDGGYPKSKKIDFWYMFDLSV